MMKTYFIIGLLSLLTAFTVGCQQEEPNTEEANSQTVEGPYLGQTPPGDMPEIFAPGILAGSFAEHSAAAFTQDGKEVFWTRVINPAQDPRLIVAMHMKEENGVWSKPELAPFTSGFWTFIRNVSPDGNRIYYDSREFIEPGGEPQVLQFVVDRTENGWNEPHLFDPLAKYGSFGSYMETRSGNLYCWGEIENAEYAPGIFRSILVDGEYQEPVLLGENINSKYLDYTYFVDPDEEYVIFSSNRPGGYAGIKLWISFHLQDGSWGPAINLGPKINSFPGGCSWPSVSPDKKYLFYTASVDPYENVNTSNYSYEKIEKIASGPENGLDKIYWVDAGFIEKLRPTEDD